jgi:hypothetical protein
MKFKLKTRLIKGGDGGNWTLLIIPKDIVAKFPNKGRFSIEGKLNGHAIKTSIFPTGDGTHHMMVNKQMQKNFEVVAGSPVDFSFTLL